MTISVTSACVSMTSSRQPRGGEVTGATLSECDCLCCITTPKQPPPVEDKELPTIKANRGHCTCDSLDGDNDRELSCHKDFMHNMHSTRETVVIIQNENNGIHLNQQPTILDCQELKRTHLNDIQASGDPVMVQDLERITRSGMIRLKHGASGTRISRQKSLEMERVDSERRCCQTSRSLERNVDMALFVIVVMLFISYIIIVIFISF